MNCKQIVITLSTILLLNGCGIYTDYQRSESLPVDNLYRDIPANMQDTNSLSELSWREFFTDSLLTLWIEKAIENNSDLKTARLRTEEAQASLQASNLSFLPSVSLSAQGSSDNLSGENASQTYSLGLSSEWEIDAFGKLRNAKKGSMAAFEASRAYEQAVQTQLVATVAEMYYSLMALDKKLAISKETEQQWQESVRVLNALKRAGEQNEIAVAQAVSNLLEVQSTIVSIEQQIHEMENSFSVLVGITPSAIERGELSEVSFKEELSVGLPVQLLRRRPDVRQAELQLAQAFYATNEARSAFYPQITLSGSAGWTNSSGASIADPKDWLINAVGSLVQPLFNKGRNTANLKIAKARQEEAQIAFTQKLLEAGAEVNNALTRWQTARKNAELNRQKIQTLQSALRGTELLMQHGNTNYLEVLTAKEKLLQAQLTEVSNKYEEIQGLINLYHAIGGGVK